MKEEWTRRDIEGKMSEVKNGNGWWPGLTIEGQISKQGSQEVHGVHDCNGDVGHMLHLFLVGAEIKRIS